MIKKRVLIVDDAEAFRLTFGALLEDEGFLVTAADSLAAARAALQAEKYDLFVLDFHLADGTGRELLPDIRARTSSAPVVFLTGSISAGDLEVRDPRAMVIEKGTSTPVILSRIRSLL